MDFVCQGVTETLRQTDGQPVPAGSVHVINASGVVGHHLSAASVGPLIAECKRVLGPEGIAMLDVGPALKAAELTRLMLEAGFESRGRFRSWWGDPTGEIVFVRK